MPHAAELVAKLVDMAKAGDTTTLRICIDRLIPPPKAKDDPLTLPAMGDSLAANGKAILQELAEGRLSPDEAQAAMSVIVAQARIVEIDDIDKRLKALEERSR